MNNIFKLFGLWVISYLLTRLFLEENIFEFEYISFTLSLILPILYFWVLIYSEKKTLFRYFVHVVIGAVTIYVYTRLMIHVVFPFVNIDDTLSAIYFITFAAPLAYTGTGMMLATALKYLKK